MNELLLNQNLYHYFMAAMLFVYGACIGSFLNVVILRLPKNQSLKGVSHCPNCRAKLRTRHLIPLASYIFLQGKCHSCRQKISPRYFIIEAVAAILFAAAYLFFLPQNFPDWLNYILTVFAISVCIAVFVIDLEHYLILNKIVFPSIVVVLVILAAVDAYNFAVGGKVGTSLLQTEIWHAIIGGIAAWLPFYALWKISQGRWMGYGDVKFVFLMGLILKWPNILVGLFLAFMSGAAIGVFLIALNKKQLTSKVPFGVFLSFSMVVAIFYGRDIVQWYKILIGLS